MTSQATQSASEIDFHIEASEIIYHTGGVGFFDVDNKSAEVRTPDDEVVPLYDWLHELNRFNTKSERMSDIDLHELAIDICFTVMPGVIPEELARRANRQDAQEDRDGR